MPGCGNLGLLCCRLVVRHQWLRAQLMAEVIGSTLGELTRRLEEVPGGVVPAGSSRVLGCQGLVR
ncbi:hypothetical protein E2562_020709 [Oryza meyeriana var. granulata]|uniref:Uncharacterized protein n=1 Tax=Oryza meyeriana var. granulata TaxID=110450 RepID=A0A6G1EN31_9ORYZ|nr:hypothetical protein E2562_020709 [Oryza meyeriana var. granulata]